MVGNHLFYRRTDGRTDDRHKQNNMPLLLRRGGHNKKRCLKRHNSHTRKVIRILITPLNMGYKPNWPIQPLFQMIKYVFPKLYRSSKMPTTKINTSGSQHRWHVLIIFIVFRSATRTFQMCLGVAIFKSGTLFYTAVRLIFAIYQFNRQHRQQLHEVY